MTPSQTATDVYAAGTGGTGTISSLANKRKRTRKRRRESGQQLRPLGSERPNDVPKPDKRKRHPVRPASVTRAVAPADAITSPIVAGAPAPMYHPATLSTPSESGGITNPRPAQSPYQTIADVAEKRKGLKVPSKLRKNKKLLSL